MTLNQITYFDKIAELENYRAAAEALHIAQPSLSKSISNLEEELGVALFEKSGRGVVLTKAGRMFQDFCRRILDDCQAASTKMHEIANGGGSIDIGYVFPLAGHFIPRHVRAFLSIKGNENVHFSFFQNHTPAIIEKVKNGSLDVGFGGCTDRLDLEYYPLLDQELMIVVPKDHPLSSRKELPITELENYPVIGYDRESWMGIHTRQLYEKLNIHPDIVIESPDEYSIIALVRENFGIALVPKTDFSEFMHGVSEHSIENYNLAHQVYMFWKKDCEHLPAVERFISYMKEQSEPETNRKKQSKITLKDTIHIDSIPLR